MALIDIQAKWVSIMDNSILNWTLKIVIYMSAVLSVWKSKNKIVHIILECIYCVVISVLPVLFLSFLIVAINGSESVDIGIGNYAAKGNKVEKIKYVVGLIIFEVMLGFMVGMVLFF